METSKPHKLSKSHRNRKKKRQLLKQQNLNEGLSPIGGPSKRVRDEDAYPHRLENETIPDSVPDSNLYIQAYEADIIRGSEARAAARSLEIYPHPGEALIQWNNYDKNTRMPDFPGEEENVCITLPHATSPDKNETWVDRYDARLLLDDLPSAAAMTNPLGSPAGWSDLPSDSEDTFFLNPEEVSDYHRDKRRRLLDASREARVKARMLEDGDVVYINDKNKEDVWGGSDEEPDEAQITLMRRTAKQLADSLNPAQLEMRVLANYGADRRFSFLRGRWGRHWKSVKEGILLEKQKEEQKGKGLGLLSGYGSESDGEGVNGGEDDTIVKEGSAVKCEQRIDNLTQCPESSDSTLDIGARIKQAGCADAEEVAKEARRARAREWAEKRRLGVLGTG